jgi:hypothetical protein
MMRKTISILSAVLLTHLSILAYATAQNDAPMSSVPDQINNNNNFQNDLENNHRVPANNLPYATVPMDMGINNSMIKNIPPHSSDMQATLPSLEMNTTGPEISTPMNTDTDTAIPTNQF